MTRHTETQYVDGMPVQATGAIVSLCILGVLSLFAFLSRGSGKGPLLQQFDMSDASTITAGIFAIVLFLPWVVVFCAAIISRGESPEYLFSMSAQQAEVLKAKPRWRRFVDAYLWALSVGHSMKPAATQCPECGSPDLRTAVPLEVVKLVLKIFLLSSLGLCIALGGLRILGASVAQYLRWPRVALIALPTVYLLFFQMVVELPKLRFCPKCNKAGTAPRAARKQELLGIREALETPAAREAWAATWSAWRNGLYSPAAKKEATRCTLDSFVNKYRDFARVVAYATKERPLMEDEFLVGFGRNDSFVLTNFAVYLFFKDTPIPHPPTVIPLCDIHDYEADPVMGLVAIRLSSGERVTGRMNNYWPKRELMDRLISDAQKERPNHGLAGSPPNA